MTIQGITSSNLTSNQKTGSGSAASELQDQFMKLLLVQLENQDPLNPMDSGAFTSQMCDLSRLEQAAVTNEHLENLAATVNNSQAVSYIGKSAKLEGDTVKISEENTGEVSFRLSDEASEVYISIFDDEGNTIWTEDLTDLSSGAFTVSLEDLDEGMAGGTYTFSVSAYDKDGESVDVTTYSPVEITGVVYEEGVPYLSSGEEIYSMTDIAGIFQS